MVTWQSIEDKVRWIAEAKWSTTCAAENIAGVDIDAVCKVKKDYWVVIEISKQNTLTKLRTDMAKLSNVRNSLWAKHIYAECYFVTSADENPSVRETAEDNNINYFTIESFEATYLGGSRYKNERLLHPFGSAVQIKTAKPDDAPYIPISYFDQQGRQWSIESIASSLRKGGNFVLTGQFGSGKSRCIMELFRELTEDSHSPTPIAINLKDSWGQNSRNSIIRDHLENLGLSEISDAVLRGMSRGGFPILLDGFDELGSQSWSNAKEVMEGVRVRATKGLKDIIEHSASCGIIVTGRDHYFSSNEEMLRCIGLQEDTIILNCPEQFSPEQARKYLDQINESLPLPPWIPKKPLICQLVASLPAEEMSILTESAQGEVEFFSMSLDAICERETKITPVIVGDTLRKILIRLALVVKKKPGLTWELSPDDINSQFKAASGLTAGEESAVLLQRLPYLGRFQADTPDRVFIDEYIWDGLTGLGLKLIAEHVLDFEIKPDWKKSLGSFGLRVLSTSVEVNQAIAIARQQANQGRNQSAIDFVASTFKSDTSSINFLNLGLQGGHITELHMVDKSISNLTLTDASIDEVYIDSIEASNVFLDNIVIGKVHGVAHQDELPEIFKENVVVEEFDNELNSAAIADLNLTDGQKTLLSIIQKLFFQPGAGRKETALLRGTARYWDQSAAKRCIKYMRREGLISTIRGQEGLVYLPNRDMVYRMKDIRATQRTSTDPLWELATSG